jgi:hypothetical protein
MGGGHTSFVTASTARGTRSGEDVRAAKVDTKASPNKVSAPASSMTPPQWPRTHSFTCCMLSANAWPLTPSTTPGLRAYSRAPCWESLLANTYTAWRRHTDTQTQSTHTHTHKHTHTHTHTLPHLTQRCNLPHVPTRVACEARMQMDASGVLVAYCL